MDAKEVTTAARIACCETYGASTDYLVAWYSWYVPIFRFTALIRVVIDTAPTRPGFLAS
jgi:hypothetical protein